LRGDGAVMMALLVLGKVLGSLMPCRA